MFDSFQREGLSAGHKIHPAAGIKALAPLFNPLQKLSGIGPRAEELLGKLLRRPEGAPKIADLLWHLPTGYIDRRLAASLNEAPAGVPVTLVAVPKKYRAPSPGVARAPFRVVCEDATGEVEVVFFHGDRRQVARLLPLGEVRILSGRLERYGGKWQMPHPDYILTEAQRGLLPLIEPIYPLTLGLSQKQLRRWIQQALALLPPVPEWLDSQLLHERGWPPFNTALLVLHTPGSDEDIALWPHARARLSFDEIFASQLVLCLLRRNSRALPGRSLISTGRMEGAIRAALPYRLTPSQETALAEIKADMAKPARMLRLLQGDVGSGKTITAMLAIAQAVEAGTQAALMAPTEVLARQHFETLTPLCKAAGITAGYLSGREQGCTRTAILQELASGKIQLLTGTHALFQPEVRFNDLGLAVIDEQHRFGVNQRLALQDKARHGDADILVMTATPIPRTLLLTLYGDLDVSRLLEKPAGRKPVITRAVPFDRLDEVIEGLNRAIMQGGQVYWVCPAVESEGAREVASAEGRAAYLRQCFGHHRVGLVHGQLPPQSKDAAIRAFAGRETPILVATTVIEVGVNVPDASVMVIENAELFGLAQLHQLRGRVGRGEVQSSCILLYKAPLSGTSKARLNILRKVDDGFVIAEEDLRLRGGGEILGAKQSGDPGFRLGVWPHIADMIDLASDQAKYLLSRSPALNEADNLPAQICLTLFERDSAVRLFQAG